MLHSLRNLLLPFVCHLFITGFMTLDTGLFDLCQGVALRDGGVAFNTLYPFGHHIRLRFFLMKGFSSDEFHLGFVTIGAFRLWLVMAAQALHSRFVDLSMFLSCGVTDITVQYSCNMFLVRKREIVNFNLSIFKSLVTFGALRMGNLSCLWQRYGPFGMAVEHEVFSRR